MSTLCISIAVKAGNPSEDELERLSTELGDKWETLGRRLSFNDAALSEFRTLNVGMAERARRMLFNWKQTKGSEATYLMLPLSHVIKRDPEEPVRKSFSHIQCEDR